MATVGIDIEARVAGLERLRDLNRELQAEWAAIDQINTLSANAAPQQLAQLQAQIALEREKIGMLIQERDLIESSLSGPSQHGARRIGGVAAGLGVMEANALTGANSVEGMSRAIRDLGSAMIMFNPAVGIAAYGLGMFTEALLKAESASEKKSLESQLKVAAQSAKEYADELALIGKIDLDQHTQAVKMLADQWKLLEQTVGMERKGEDAILGAEGKFRKVSMRAQLMDALSQESNPARRAQLRQQFADLDKVSSAEAEANLATLKSERGKEDLLSAEGRKENLLAQSQATEQALANAQAARYRLPFGEFRGEGGAMEAIRPDQQLALQRLEALEKRSSQLAESGGYLGGNERLELEALRSQQPKLEQAVKEGRFSFDSALASAQKGQAAIPGINTGAIAAMEGYQKKASEANSEITKLQQKLGELAEQIQQQDLNIKGASDRSAALQMEEAAARKNIGVTAQESNQAGIDREQAAQHAAAQSSLRDAEHLLGQERSDLASQLHSAAGSLVAKTQAERNAVAMIERHIKEASTPQDLAKLAQEINAMNGHVDALGQSVVNAMGQAVQTMRSTIDRVNQLQGAINSNALSGG